MGGDDMDPETTGADSETLTFEKLKEIAKEFPKITAEKPFEWIKYEELGVSKGLTSIYPPTHKGHGKSVWGKESEYSDYMFKEMEKLIAEKVATPAPFTAEEMHKVLYRNSIKNKTDSKSKVESPLLETTGTKATLEEYKQIEGFGSF